MIEAVLLDEEDLISQVFIQNPSLIFLDTEQEGKVWDSDSSPKEFTNKKARQFLLHKSDNSHRHGMVQAILG